MNILMKKLFENRGYSDDFFDKIMVCNHGNPKGTDELCQALKELHDSGDHLVLLTDIDMDGIMCGVIGFAGLSELGFNVSLFRPNAAEGYGFDAMTIDDLLSEYPDAKAVMTADVGITAYEGVKAAKARGLKVFVTDHHRYEYDPGADIAVDPLRPDDDVSYDDICGAHVLYLVLRHYAQFYSDNPGYMVSQMDRLRVFAGFGTMSDNMLVYHENRPLIKDAVSICRVMYGDGLSDVADAVPGCDVYRRAFLGLHLMLKCFADNGKISDSNNLNEEFFSFYAAPTFNSIKRMGDDISKAYLVFFGGKESAEESLKAIFALNEQRKHEVEVAYRKMRDESTVQPWAPYIYVTDAKPGLCGLLAQQVLSSTGLPAFVVCEQEDGTYSGSGRCPEWFPFLVTNKDSEGYWHGAGHQVAFGVFVKGDVGMDKLQAYLKREVALKKPADEFLFSKPDFVISETNEPGDCGLDMDLFEDFLEELEVCRPFGHGFPAPNVLLRFYTTDGNWYIIGKEKNHVKIVLPHGFNVLCFKQAEQFGGSVDLRGLPPVIEMTGKLCFNEYMGVRSVQFLGQLPGDLVSHDSDAFKYGIKEGLFDDDFES